MTDEPTGSSSDEPPDRPASGSRRRTRRTNGAPHADAQPRARTTRPAARETPSRPSRPGRPSREPDAILPRPPSTLERAEAEHLELHQGRIGSALARSVTVRQGFVGGAQADEVIVTQGAVGGARAQRISVDKGAVGGAIAGDFRLRMGFAQSVLARDVTIEQGGARTIIGNTVTMGRQSGALVVIARRVEGGRILLDWRGALVIGVMVALAAALMRRVDARR